MPDTTSTALHEADLEKFCDAFDWDGWTDQKVALRAFARAVLAKWSETTPPAVAELPSKCKCTFAQKMQGDGCRYCNPQEYIDRLHEQLDDDAREPLADSAIVAAFCDTPGLSPRQMVSCFVAGARFAEQHHGINRAAAAIGEQMP